jgi:hypothetical protein
MLPDPLKQNVKNMLRAALPHSHITKDNEAAETSASGKEFLGVTTYENAHRSSIFS